MPDVDFQVEGGQLPEYDVETGSVDVGTEETTIDKPEVNVEMTEETVTVPTIDIATPDETSRR